MFFLLKVYKEIKSDKQEPVQIQGNRPLFHRGNLRLKKRFDQMPFPEWLFSNPVIDPYKQHLAVE